MEHHCVSLIYQTSFMLKIMISSAMVFSQKMYLHNSDGTSMVSCRKSTNHLADSLIVLFYPFLRWMAEPARNTWIPRFRKLDTCIQSSCCLGGTRCFLCYIILSYYTYHINKNRYIYIYTYTSASSQISGFCPSGSSM